MELTDNDRQRIEQEAIVYTEGHGSTHKNWRGFIDGYEAATIYEREQQAKPKESLNEISYRLYKTDYKYISLDPCKVEVLEIYTNRLEAERSELRKENEELKFLLEFGKSYLPKGYVNDSKGNGFIFKDRLEAALNSLKTK